MLKLVGARHFESSYVDYVRSLVPGWGWASVRYFLNKRVMKHRMYMVFSDDSWWNQERAERVKAGHVPDEVIVFITVPSNFDTTMAPPGKQCLVTGTICSPDPDAAEVEMLYGKLDEMLAKLFPEAWAAVERRECEGPAEVSRHTRDHVLSLRAISGAGRARIVRSYPRAEPIPPHPWNRWLFGRATDGLLCVSRRAADASERLRRGRPTAA